MLQRVVLIAGAVLAFVVVGDGAPRTQLPGEALILSGWVRVSTGPDGLATVVTVAVPHATADGKETVDSAFRVQHARPAFLDYEGFADVVFEGKRLTVLAGNGTGWQFSVATGLPESTLVASRLQRVPVIGLSRHSGAQVQGDADAVSASLLSGICRAGGTDGGVLGGCESCEAGGPGFDSCEVGCGDSGCSAECGAGYHACCSCPLSCGCCANQIQAAVPPRPR
jgi:hypothetical protein